LEELRRAAAWIAADNTDAADDCLDAVDRAATMVGRRPALGRGRLDLAPARYPFWSLRDYLYMLVFDVRSDAPTVDRVVHQARDLPALLDDLDT
jgi:plasmid stabilization system protein ParE